MRVEGWYRSGNLAPEPRTFALASPSEAELRTLGSAFREDTRLPIRSPQVPYTKKGACLLTTRFPPSEIRSRSWRIWYSSAGCWTAVSPNFVLGNRWNRRIAWERRRFLWTPRRSPASELARLRGQRLFLIADVIITVKELLHAQLHGVRDAVSTAACDWAGTQHGRCNFKSPPPGFQRRARVLCMPKRDVRYILLG